MDKQVLVTIPHMRVVNIIKENIRAEIYTHIPKKFIGGWVNICDNDYVVARFKFDRYTRIPVKYSTKEGNKWTFDTRAVMLLMPHLVNARKDIDTLSRYAKGQDLYVWHIDSLQVFPTPRPLSDFIKVPKGDYDGADDWDGSITEPPQTWRFVIEREDNDDTSTT